MRENTSLAASLSLASGLGLSDPAGVEEFAERTLGLRRFVAYSRLTAASRPKAAASLELNAIVLANSLPAWPCIISELMKPSEAQGVDGSREVSFSQTRRAQDVASRHMVFQAVWISGEMMLWVNKYKESMELHRAESTMYEPSRWSSGVVESGTAGDLTLSHHSFSSLRLYR